MVITLIGCIMFEELVREVILLIEKTEGRSRNRTHAAQISFEHALHIMLLDLWKSIHSLPVRECLINKRSGYYSENRRYRDPLLTYKQTIAAFNGLEKLGFIEVTQEGYFDRPTLQGGLTRFVAKDELLERLQALEGHPAVRSQVNHAHEIIMLRNTIDGKKSFVEYEDTPTTEGFRENLRRVNKCFSKHWFDLEIKDDEVDTLAQRILKHPNKEPIDFSKRSLVRTFANGSFKEGGRFYRGWWQNVPSEYRKYITIDEKRTAEVDFSQLNPHLLYISNYKELGSEDAYSRVLDGENRDVVKQAFNAMVHASGPLNNCPNDIDLGEIDMSWSELRDRVISAHKPIADQFFIGIGNKLQYKDSCIAQRVMLHFTTMNAPALPIQDSFIVHHGYAEYGEIEEVMRRAFYEEMGEHISKVDTEILSWTYRKHDHEELASFPSIDEIIAADDDVSLWRNRHQLWYESRINAG